jgi:hypothetical protein
MVRYLQSARLLAATTRVRPRPLRRHRLQRSRLVVDVVPRQTQATALLGRPTSLQAILRA